MTQQIYFNKKTNNSKQRSLLFTVIKAKNIELMILPTQISQKRYDK